MKAALVCSTALSLINICTRHTRVSMHAHRCMFSSFKHRHLSLDSGLTADPECLYLFTAAAHCQEPPSPHATTLRATEVCL